MNFPFVLDPLFALLEAGGAVAWVLAALSIAASTLVLVKLVQLCLLQPERTTDVERALQQWQAGRTEAARAALVVSRPISAIVAQAMAGAQQPDADPALVQSDLQRLAQGKLAELRSYLRPLEVIAALSPLLGLLGTVLGMILAFQQMESAGAQVDPSVLSGGIWQALLTTAIGLGVAIPVVAINSWFERKVERVAHQMNDAVTRVFTWRPEREAIEAARVGVGGEYAA